MPAEVASAYLTLIPRLPRGELDRQISPHIGRSGERQGRIFGSTFARASSGPLKSVVGVVGGPMLAAFGAVASINVFKSAIQGASDLNESATKIAAIFGDAQGQINKFAAGGAAALGQSKQSVLDAAATFGTFGKSAGLSGGKLAEFSTGFVGLATDLASFNNTSPEQAVEAIGSALRGEAEPLRQYGVLMDDASLRQQALKLGLIKTTKEALTPQNKVLAAQALIYAQTKDAQGDFARTSGGLANQQRILSATFTDVKAKIGSAFLPIAVAATTALNRGLIPAFARVGGLLGRLGPSIASFKAGLSGLGSASGFVGTINDLGLGFRALFLAFRDGDVTSNGLVGAFERVGDAGHRIVGVVRDQLGPVFTRVGAFLRDNVRPILAGVGAALAVLVTPVILGAVGALASVVGGALLAAFSGLAAALASPAVLLGALVAVLVKAYRESEPLRTAVGHLTGAFRVFLDVFKGADDAGGVKGFFDGLKAGLAAAVPIVQDALVGIGKALWQWIGKQVAPALTALGVFVRAIGSWLRDTGLPLVVSAFVAYEKALWGFIFAAVPPALRALGSFIGTVSRWVVTTGLPLLLDKVQALGSALVSWIAPRAVSAVQALGSFMATLGRWVLNTGLPLLIEKAKALGGALVDWIGPRVVPALTALGGFVSRVASWVTDVGLPRLVNSIKGWAAAIWEWVGPRIPDLLGALGKLMGKVVGWVVGTGIPLLVGGLLLLSYKLVTWVAPRIPGLLLEMVKLLGSVTKWIVTDGIPVLVKSMVSFGKNAVTGFGSAITKSPLVTTLKTYFGGIVEDIKTSITGLWTSLKLKFQIGARGIVDTFAGAMESVLTLGASIPGPLKDDFQKAVGGVKTFREGFNRETAKLEDELVNINVSALATVGTRSANDLLAAAAGLRAGGPVRGPGTGTSDSVPIWASTGEHMWTAREVSNAGGHGAVESIRSMFRYAKGGPIAAFQELPPRGFAHGMAGITGKASDRLAGSLERSFTSVLARAAQKSGLFAGDRGHATPNGVGGLGPAARRARQAVIDTFGITNIGGYSYRNIAGTNVLSKHALGKAIDVMTYDAGMRAAVANFFIGRAGQFGVDNVIWSRKIWNRGKGVHPYTGVSPHTDHTHVDFFDKGGNVPCYGPASAPRPPTFDRRGHVPLPTLEALA